MDLTQIPLFEALSKRMGWLNQRQAVLAENVANADTPGYLAQDLHAPDFGNLVAGAMGGDLTLVTTDPGHITPHQNTGGFKKIATPGERSVTGNSVSLEGEMMKVSQNASDYSMVESLYRAQLGLIKTVLGSNSGGSSS
jgi:flagellar basal-body rod protein FlgB